MGLHMSTRSSRQGCWGLMRLLAVNRRGTRAARLPSCGCPGWRIGAGTRRWKSFNPVDRLGTRNGFREWTSLLLTSTLALDVTEVTVNVQFR